MSTLLLNTLTGKTSAGSIVVTGEGGSTTTNMQQGLIKQWVHFEGNAADLDTGNYDSFNTASLTDNGNGDYDVTITNDMASAFYAIARLCSTNRVNTTDSNTMTAGSYNIETKSTYDNSAGDTSESMLMVAGDLA